MKTLFLLRHAKSSWDDATLADRDRPLDARGERDVAQLGKRLSTRHVQPDVIISSPALRALSTAKAVAKALDFKRKDIVVDDRLYAGRVDEVLNVISGLADEVKRAMLVGHNPEMTELAHRLSSTITHMPTCAMAVFTFDARSWSDIGTATPLESDFASPKGSSG